MDTIIIKIAENLPTWLRTLVKLFLSFAPIPALFKRTINLKYLEIAGDLAGYEVLIQFLINRGLMNLPGDLIEIGSFVGTGTAKLARFAKPFGKKVYAIDIFSVNADKSKSVSGVMMSNLYSSYLERIGMSQWECYRYMIRDLSNVITIRNDSMKVKFPANKKFIFGFIDGNHSSEYVENDFYLISRHLTTGGAVAFHDYEGDLPQVTKTVNFLITKHSNEISELIKIPKKQILIIVKK